MTTPKMGMTLPVIGITTDPTWSQQLLAALALIDAHDHSTGKGAALSPDFTGQTLIAQAIQIVAGTIAMAAVGDSAISPLAATDRDAGHTITIAGGHPRLGSGGANGEVWLATGSDVQFMIALQLIKSMLPIELKCTTDPGDPQPGYGRLWANSSGDLYWHYGVTNYKLGGP